MATSLLYLSAACLAAISSASEPAPRSKNRTAKETIQNLTPEDQVILDRFGEEKRMEEKYRVRDRKNHVRPAPPEFSPAATGRKLKITLIPEKTMVRKGSRFRYHVEIQNVGTEEVLFHENPSFILEGKFGFSWGGKFRFLLTPPDGRELEAVYMDFRRLPPEPTETFSPPAGWEKLSSRERDEKIKDLNIEGRLRSVFSVYLKPGETIYTWDYSKGETQDGRFTDLFASHGIAEGLPLRPVWTTPGTYRIKLVYEDRPPAPPTENQIARMMKYRGTREKVLEMYREAAKKSLGLVESNTVTFELTQ